LTRSISGVQPVLVGGSFRTSDSTSTFAPQDPSACEPTGETFPVSSRAEIEEVIRHAYHASLALREVSAEAIAAFLELFASDIQQCRRALVETAHTESALPKNPRLDEVELPRTVSQLRLAADAVRDGSWALPTIDTKASIRSLFGPLEGGVTVFGPNNFPFAFNSSAGGDFAAAIAAGNPVIAKANTSHPGTTRLFAELALAAVKRIGLPDGTVQLIYRTDHETGKLLVAHPSSVRPPIRARGQRV
jgi:alpha-ketoglutaric semialdehyde dehydrogenase